MTQAPPRSEIESILERKELELRKAKDEFEERSLEYTTLRSAIELLGLREARTQVITESKNAP